MRSESGVTRRVRGLLRHATLTERHCADIAAMLTHSAARGTHVPILRLIVDSRHAMDAALLAQFAHYDRDLPDKWGDTALHALLRAFCRNYSVLLDDEAAYDLALGSTMRACAVISSAENVNARNVDGESPLQILCVGMASGAVRSLTHMRSMEALVRRMLAVGATWSMRHLPEAVTRRLSYVPAIVRRTCGGCMQLGPSVRPCARCSASCSYLRKVRRLVVAVSDSDIRDERVRRALGECHSVADASHRLSSYLVDPASDPHLVGLAVDSDALASFLSGDVADRIEAARRLTVWAYCALVSATTAFCSRECLASHGHLHVGRCVVLYRHAKAQYARFTSGAPATTLLLDEAAHIDAVLRAFS